jgi:hypothetical protein
MLRMCVLTVFSETDSSLAISGRDRFVGQIAQHPELAWTELLRRRR